jgi:hypothetical protein
MIGRVRAVAFRLSLLALASHLRYRFLLGKGAEGEVEPLAPGAHPKLYG